MKKILLILFIIFFICGCSSNQNTIVMVTEAGFAPYEYYENGEIVGVDVDIAQEIAKELGKELIIKDVAFDSIINEIKTGKADFGAAGISYSDERSQQVDFTINYTTSKQVMVINKSQTFSPDDLENAKIAVQLGSVADTYVSKNYPNATITRQKKYLAAVQDLLANKVDVLIMDELPAKEIISANYGLTILDQVLFEDTYGMIVKKGNQELLDAINKVLERLKEEGKIDEFIINHTNN